MQEHPFESTTPSVVSYIYETMERSKVFAGAAIRESVGGDLLNTSHIYNFSPYLSTKSNKTIILIY